MRAPSNQISPLLGRWVPAIKRGLSGAVGAHQPDDLTRRDGKADAAQGGDAAIGFADIVEAKQRHGLAGLNKHCARPNSPSGTNKTKATNSTPRMIM